MKTNSPILEVIKMRRSIRTFEKEGLDNSMIEKVRSLLIECSGMKTPFSTKPSLRLTEADLKNNDDSVKIGTYGVIKGASGYIVSQSESHDEAIVDTGFMIEHAILALTDIGISTCWLGGTFNRKDFQNLESHHAGSIIPAVVPIGIKEERVRLTDSMMRRIAGSDKRKGWEELFFIGDLETPLTPESAGIWADALDMVRIAPSASNKQPWRFSLDLGRGAIHLFLAQTPRYAGNNFGFNMQMLDAGIALCHLTLTLKSQNIDFELEHCPPNLEMPDGYHSYIMSLVCKE